MYWRTIERPGYLGKKRDELHAQWTRQFGEGNWRLAYHWGSLIIPQREGIQVYEDGYCEFFKRDIETLEWLVSTASDVYDTALPMSKQASIMRIRKRPITIYMMLPSEELL